MTGSLAAPQNPLYGIIKNGLKWQRAIGAEYDGLVDQKHMYTIWYTYLGVRLVYQCIAHLVPGASIGIKE